MYNCDECHKTIPAHIKQTRITIKTRKKVYSPRQGANRVASWKEDKQDKIASTNDSGGTGYEIAIEKKMCPNCATKYLESAEPVKTKK